MPSIARILLTSAILLGIISLIEWGAWRNVNRMWAGNARLEQIRWAWRVVTVVQYVWTVIYFVRWPHWREFSIGWLLLTHAVLISLLVPKLFLCGVEMLEGIRYWGQWALTGSP